MIIETKYRFRRVKHKDGFFTFKLPGAAGQKNSHYLCSQCGLVERADRLKRHGMN
jgi:hypothetical protein